MLKLLAIALLASVYPIEASLGEWNNPANPQYHIQTDEGPERYFRYQTHSGQYRKEKRLEDGTVIGSYAWIDDDGYLRQRDYIADTKGYRILKTKNLFVGKNTNVGEAVKAAKKVPSSGGTKYNSRRPTYSNRNGYVAVTPRPAYLPPTAAYPEYPSSTPSPIYLPSVTPSYVEISNNAVPLPNDILPPKEDIYYQTSTPAPHVVPSSTPSALYIPSVPRDDLFIPSSTPLPPVSSTPATFYIPSSTPEPSQVYLPSSTPSTEYLPSTYRPHVVSTPAPVSSTYLPPTLGTIYVTSKPYRQYMPSRYVSSTPSPVYIPSRNYVAQKASQINSLEYSGAPQYEQYTSNEATDDSVNPYIHQNGPTYPIDTRGQSFNPKYRRIGNGYDPQYPYYDGISVTNDGFRYYIPRAYHEEQGTATDTKSGSFGYIDPFGIRRVIYYNAGPDGFKHRKNNRYVGFNATPYDPRPV